MKKEEARIFCIHCAVFALSTVIAIYIFLFMLSHSMGKGMSEVSELTALFGIPAVFLIGDFFYFLRRIKKRIEFEPYQGFILFISGAFGLLLFVQLFFDVPF